jgi:hypothetical protein
LKVFQHAVIGTAVALPIMFFSAAGSVFFFAATVLADIDHLIFYAFQRSKGHSSFRTVLFGYEKWDYFGPRIHVLHNYEALILSGAFSLYETGVSLYLFAGLCLHLICDQVDTYSKFRYLRVKTLIGDILRFRKYIRAVNTGQEKQYLIARRDSWRRHLESRLSPEQLEDVSSSCDILNIYPEIAIHKEIDHNEWKKVF